MSYRNMQSSILFENMSHITLIIRYQLLSKERSDLFKDPGQNNMHIFN